MPREECNSSCVLPFTMSEAALFVSPSHFEIQPKSKEEKKKRKENKAKSHPSTRQSRWTGAKLSLSDNSLEGTAECRTSRSSNAAKPASPWSKESQQPTSFLSAMETVPLLREVTGTRELQSQGHQLPGQSVSKASSFSPGRATLPSTDAVTSRRGSVR